jgi:fermentation-respiration switch protein FrsA (DUF1100 family)
MASSDTQRFQTNSQAEIDGAALYRALAEIEAGGELARVYAERFAEAGLAVLVFDYRQFGASDGEPRQIVDVDEQRADYHAAVRFARTMAGIDPERIALWGTSLSGDHVIAVAAEDPRTAAVVAQAPLIDAWRTGGATLLGLRRTLTRSALKLFLAAGRDVVHAVLGRPSYLARVVGLPGEAAVFTDPEAKAAFAALGGEAAEWRNAFTPRFVLGLPRRRPGTAERLRMPLLVCIADHDLGPPRSSHWRLRRGPHVARRGATPSATSPSTSSRCGPG